MADSDPAFISNLPKTGPIGALLAPVAGFGVTLRNFFRHVDRAVPDGTARREPQYHGRHQLNRYADGLEKCIGCELCAWACPADAIYVEGDSNTPDAQFARASATEASTRSTTCAASSAGCASRRAPRARSR